MWRKLYNDRRSAMPPTQSCMAVVTGCRSQRSVRVEWKHLQLLQACIKVLCQMWGILVPGSSRVVSNAITAGCSALRKLHRASLWGNLRPLWTSTLGGWPAHCAIRRKLQLCLQEHRQWHSVYGIEPSERNGASLILEPASSIHFLLGAQDMSPCRSV